VLLVVSFLGIVAFSLVAPGPTALDQAVSHLVSLVPGLAGWFWEVSYDLLIGWALLLTVGPLVVRGRRRLLLDALLAALLSFGFAALARRIGGTSWSAILGALLDAHPPAVYPAIRLAVATAIVATASPHIARPLRYIGRWVIAVGALAAIALGIALPLGILTGYAVGLAAAAVTHLLLGSPGGRLSLEQVAAALRDLGVDATAIRHVPLQTRGVALATASLDGRPLLVKIFGRDAWDGQLIASTCPPMGSWFGPTGLPRSATSGRQPWRSATPARWPTARSFSSPPRCWSARNGRSRRPPPRSGARASRRCCRSSSPRCWIVPPGTWCERETGMSTISGSAPRPRQGWIPRSSNRFGG